MKSKRITKILAILMSIQMVLSMVPASVFAESDAAAQANSGQQTEGTVQEQTVQDTDTVAEESADTETEVSVPDEGVEQEAQPVEENTEPETPVETEQNEDIKDEDAGDDTSVETEESSDAETSGKVEVHGVSKTNNIVGDVFVNMLNAANDPELDALRQESLKKYPLESHELSYYDGTLRVRYLDGGDDEGPNYLVYRDSYLIVSEEESADYEVKYSEDGLTAYVTPAVPADELEGKTGLVLLGENVGYDDILVFDGAPEFEDGFMTVPLKATEDITVNELFSDGKLVPKDQSEKKGAQKAGIGPIHWETEPSGTNWKADINSFDVDWPKPGFAFDVWELLFEIRLGLHFELGFEIETTGSSNGLETKRIAGFNIPVDIFDLAMNYNLQVKFGAEPINVKGTIITEFDYGIGTHGGTLNNYRTKVNISELTVKNPSDYNKDIDFYIGSQLTSEASVIKIDIDIWITEITIGPVFKLALDCRGGCYFTARHEKDLFSPPPDKTKNEIHTCTAEGEDGCLSLKSVEKYRTNIWFKIDLYFDDWTFDITDPSEKTVETKYYYNSYTFKSGMKEGFCPHHFYKVPVRVWLDEDKTVPAPAGMAVTVSDALDIHESEKDLVAAQTNDNGEATLFLPYKDEYCYTCVATGTIDGKQVAGSKRTIYIKKTPETNPTVHIILRSDEKTKVKVNINWNVDSDKKDVPSSNHSLRLVLYRRAAGTDDEWQEAGNADDFGSAVHWTDKAHGWAVDDWTVPKFGFKNGKASLYEYRVRILEEINTNHYAVITPENDNCFINRHVDAYENAAGLTEQSHTSKYHIGYDDEVTDDVTTTTITGTAVMDVNAVKKWKLADPEKKPESVYLAVQQKPETGWESEADAARVPAVWVPVLNPLSGNSTTLKELKDAELLTTADYTGDVESTPLTIGKVNDDNNWKLTYRVPKYRKGVQMQFEGSELDSSVITRLLKYEYDLETRATVPSFGDFASVPGLALNDDDYTKTANIINMDPLPENTILGTVRWQSDEYGSWWNYVPGEVRLNVYKNGEEINGSPITLKKDDYNMQDTWIWTLTMDPEEFDPDAEYTVKETFPDGSKEWVGVVTGLDVYNYRIWYDYVQCEAQAIFDYEPPINEIKVNAHEKGSSSPTWNFNLEKSDSWWTRNADKKKTEVKDISEYEMSAPEIPGYVRVYGEPYAYTRPGWGNLFYNFTVYYIKQSDHLNLHITKEWDKTDDSTVYPKEVKVTVYRDGEQIAEETIKKKALSQKWDEVVVSEDADGNDLKRLNEDGQKYNYTIVETPVDGFTSELARTQDDGGDDIYYTLKNTWVGADNVNVKGTVKWEGDEGKEHLRPETVSLSVINSKEEYVKTVKVKTDGNGKWEAKYLPAKDKNGDPLTYSVLESHVKGYTAKYAEPVYDENSRTWTCDVTNKLTGYFPLKIKKTIEGDQPEEKETYKFDIQVKEGATVNADDRENPLPVNNDKLSIEGEGEVTAEFLIDEEGLYLYSAKEQKGENEKCSYDETEKLILISKSYDEETGEPKFRSWVGEAEKDKDEDEGSSSNDGENTSTEENSDVDESVTDDKDLPEKESDTVEFVNKYPTLLTIEKKWDIDLQKSDRPDSIEVVVQEKKGDKWEDATVQVKKGDDWEEATEIELSSSNDWKVQVNLDKKDKKDDKDSEGNKNSGSKGKSDSDDDKKPEYRVRELTEKNALDELSDKIKEMITGGVDSSYDNVINYIKGYDGGKYYNALPDGIKEAADKGVDALKEKLDATTENLYDKLLEKMGLSSDRIVYDDDDDDKGDADANQVRYHADGHITKYQVKYEEDDGSWTITNKAILDVDVIKRWVGIGVDDDDMPDAAWVVLLFKPDPDAIADAEKIPGVDLSGLVKYEFPEFSPFLLEGGNDPVAIISKLALGIDLDIFGKFLPKFAIARVTEDDDWTAKFVVSKYALGIPLEFKGAELGSEIIRQIVKYLTGIDSFVSYNPFDNYFSIPTKAIRTIMGIENLSDITDLSGLAGKFWEKAKSLSWDDIKSLDPNVLFDDWHLMGNAINVKIDWDIDNPDSIEGKKIWKDDKEENRPETLIIHVKDGDKEIEGSPVTLEKSDFEGEDTWTWSIDLKKESDDEDGGEDGDDVDKEESKIDIDNLVVTEEYPEDYEYKDKYTSRTDDLDITNTWHDEEPDTIDIQGKKIWKDDNDKDKLRPDKIIVRLLADGKEIKSVETSKAGGWKYEFDKLPKYKENNGEEDGDDNSGDSGNTGGDENTGGEGSGNGDSGDSKTEIKYEIAEVEVEGYETTVDGYNLINTHKSETITVEGVKVWDDNNNEDMTRPESITIRLKANGEEVKSTEVTEDDDWAWKFEDLPKTSKGKDITYTITEDAVKDYTTEITQEEPEEESTGGDGNASDGDENTGSEEPAVISFKVTNTHNPGKTQVSVSKVWNDDDNRDGIRPESVEVKLLADGEEKPNTLTLSEKNNWTGVFENLAVMKDEKEIVYTVEEVKTEEISGEDSDGTYAIEVEGDAGKGFTVKNTHTPQTITIEGEKVWDDDDDRDGIRPQRVMIRLKDGDKELEHAVVTDDDDWTWKFEDLHKYAQGKEIEYTVEEDEVESYEAEIKQGDDGKYTVTNKHKPETIRIRGEKIWDDADDQDGKRPDSITIKVKANGKEVEDAAFEVKKSDFEGENTWTWESGDLPKFEKGEEIEYTIEEVQVDGYTTETRQDEDGKYIITNKHTPELIDIDVDKVWEDEDDQDGKRPESVTVHLKAGEDEDADEKGEATLSDKENWTWTFRNVPKYADGEEIKYTIAEDEPDGYVAEVKGSAEEGFTVTNKYTPIMIEVTGKKVWKDNEDQDGKRPESITVRLKADGKEVRTTEVTEQDGWEWSFNDLPQYMEGDEITYTITEDTVPEYTTDISGDTEEGFTVTNTYTPGKTQVNVTKVWDDEDDQDNIRPASVTVKLLAGGAETGKTLTLSEACNWTGTFTDLDTMRRGKAISYSVEESLTDVITGTDGLGTYAVKISGSATEGFTVTNTHRPEKITVEGQKVWKDNDNQEGKRPDSIVIRLKADGTECKVKKVTAADGWKWRIGLPKHDGDREIVYTLTEDAVPGYTTLIKGSAQEGFTVTNTYDPEKTQVTVNKVWKDNNDQDGIRPDSVTVKLLADGQDTRKREILTADNKWQAVFDDLSVENASGDKIVYTAEEIKDGVITGTDGEGTYASKVSGNADKGFTITNTHTPTTVKVDVAKVWNDADDQDGIRPKEVTVKLLANGDPATDNEGQPMTVTLSENNNWKGKFTGLPQKTDGAAVTYSVEEEKTDVITGTDTDDTYAVEVSGNANKGFTITNTHTPAAVKLEAAKVWSDADNQDGIRPDEVTIELLADGDPATDDAGQPATLILSEENNWKGEFTGIPKNKDGKKIEYTIDEEKTDVITGKDGRGTYSYRITGSFEDGYVVTNNHTPVKTEVRISLAWDDKDNMDKIRPGSVVVKLLADGKDTGKSVKLSAWNGWTATFKDLDEMKAGKPVKYTVEEQLTDVITGKDTRNTYAVKITGDQSEGYTITNKHTPERFTITYKLNGGTYKGSPDDIKEIYKYGTKISIHKKPVREGYEFLYWKGSKYQPGDKYTVKADHTFVAQWKKSTEPGSGKPGKPGKTARTGDETNIGIWLAAALIAAAVLAGVLIWRRRRRDD